CARPAPRDVPPRSRPRRRRSRPADGGSYRGGAAGVPGDGRCRGRDVHAVSARMTPRRVVVVEGDGAAPEAVRPTVALVAQLGLPIEWVHPAVDDPRAVRKAIDASDATLFGATSGAAAPALFHLRWGRATYANVRPARWHPGYRSPLARPERVDLVIVRENLEDLYVGVEGDLAALRPLGLGSPLAGGAGADLGPGRFALQVITEPAAERAGRLR